jgi:hypothetical protein
MLPGPLAASSARLRGRRRRVCARNGGLVGSLFESLRLAVGLRWSFVHLNVFFERGFLLDNNLYGLCDLHGLCNLCGLYGLGFFDMIAVLRLAEVLLRRGPGSLKRGRRFDADRGCLVVLKGRRRMNTLNEFPFKLVKL